VRCEREFLSDPTISAETKVGALRILGEIEAERMASPRGRRDDRIIAMTYIAQAVLVIGFCLYTVIAVTVWMIQQ